MRKTNAVGANLEREETVMPLENMSYRGKKTIRANGASSLGTLPQRAGTEIRAAGHSEAFTLIDLLVVIAIIGILAAMLLSALSRSKQQAWSTVCKNHEHQMGIALQMYVEDTKDYPYYANYIWGPSAQGEFHDWIPWQQSLQPYYSLSWTNPAYHCPAYNGAISTNSAGLGMAFGSYGYNLWGANQGQEPTTGLGVNSLGAGAPNGDLAAPRLESQVVAPGETFAFIDSAEVYENSIVQAYSSGVPSGTWLAWLGSSAWSGMDAAGCLYQGCDPFNQEAFFLSSPKQHDSYFNVGFCDAHVAQVRLIDLFNPTNTASNWNFDHQAHLELWNDD
jgi:prepilin-type processing-associated H-X9-DG protein